MESYSGKAAQLLQLAMQLHISAHCTLVDDEQLDGGELRLEPEQTLFVARLHQLMHEAGGRGEGDGQPALASGEAERQADMRLARAARGRDMAPDFWRVKRLFTMPSIL